MLKKLFCQQLHNFAKSIFFSHISGKNDIGYTGKETFLSGSPDGNSRLDLAQNKAAAGAEGLDRHITGSDAALGDEKGGSNRKLPYDCLKPVRNAYGT